MSLDARLVSRLPKSTVLLCTLVLALPAAGLAKATSEAEIAKEIKKQTNRAIIDEFLKCELRDVNRHVTDRLLSRHPSLVFFVKQVDKGPLKSLFFLEEWVHRLRDAQKNIDSLPYSITFSSAEKKKILGLKPVTERIISYGIPLMKRDFYSVVVAAKELAAKRGKSPLALIPDIRFRDAIYRHVKPTAAGLDAEMGELSKGELICMRLGWVLEQVTVTRLWLTINDNTLPEQADYMVYRKKRSEYFQKRLRQIYGR